MKATSSRLTVGSLRELSAVGVVCALSATYSTTLVCASSILGTMATVNGGSVGLMLDIVASVFILIALFVAGVVISNGVDTVIAGRRKELSLLRLVGASSRQLRDSLVNAVAKVAVVGALAGVVVGVAGSWALRVSLVHRGTLPVAHYDVLPPLVFVGVLAVIGTAVGATYIGSRSALSGAAVSGTTRVVRSWLRDLAAAAFIAGGRGAVDRRLLPGGEGEHVGLRRRILRIRGAGRRCHARCRTHRPRSCRVRRTTGRRVSVGGHRP
ncbi:FtsX-like permease family protein [Gordonia humi]|uniref:ABC transporter permease n=1 Tax=Gordonia humi TaxID=686429 RepID=UPI0036105429